MAFTLHHWEHLHDLLPVFTIVLFSLSPNDNEASLFEKCKLGPESLHCLGRKVELYVLLGLIFSQTELPAFRQNLLTASLIITDECHCLQEMLFPLI